MTSMWGNCRVFITPLVVLALIFREGVAQSPELRHSNVLVLRSASDTTIFRTGLDLLIENEFSTLNDFSITVIANRGSFSHTNQHTFDVFKAGFGKQCRSLVQVVEGVSQPTAAGFIFHDSEMDSSTRYFTLTAADYALNDKILNGAAMIVVDLQDSGLRESLALGVLIEALKISANNQIPFIILDRPSPLNAVETGGPVSTKTPFADGCRLPVRHGLTIGELALLINEENWLKNDQYASLTVIKMANYYRDMRWQQTGLKWSYPDDLVMDEETAIFSAGLYFFRYTNVSLGAGTIQPYQFIGAPWISARELVDVMKREKLPGLDVRAVKFTPKCDAVTGTRPLYTDTECSGISVRINDFAKFDVFKFSTILLSAIARLYPQHFQWILPADADLFFGNTDFRTWVNIGADLKPMLATWIADATAFQKLRLKYCLYPLQKN